MRGRWAVALLAAGACERASAPQPAPMNLDPSGMKHASMPPRDAADVVIARPPTAPDDPAELRVAMTATGAVYVNGNAVTTAELDQALAAAAKRDPETQMILAADSKSTYQSIVALMDRATKAGLKNIALEAAPAAATP